MIAIESGSHKSWSCIATNGGDYEIMGGVTRVVATEADAMLRSAPGLPRRLRVPAATATVRDSRSVVATETDAMLRNATACVGYEE